MVNPRFKKMKPYSKAEKNYWKVTRMIFKVY